MANINHGLQRLMESLNTATKEYGKKINFKKTKIMKISRHS